MKSFEKLIEKRKKIIMPNILNRMINLQKSLQDKLGTNIHTQEFINMNGYALIAEVIEALNETPWKPWKKNQSFNRNEFKMEIIDCFHFLINLCLSVDMNASEIYELYYKKNMINQKRCQNGY